MSAPVIWIILPGVLGFILLLFRRHNLAVTLVGISFSLILVWIAWRVSIGESYLLLPWPRPLGVTINESLTFLGRRLVLTDASRPALILIYSGAAFWFGGAYIARAHHLFVGLGLGIAALLTASLAVEPFLYSSLLLQGVAVLTVPILYPPGQASGRGVLRFIIFQTMGIACILFAGGLLSILEVSPGDPSLLWRATTLMALGFALVLAVFPFHTWLPMTAEESHPFAASFIFFFLPAAVVLLAVDFLQRYVSLGIAPSVDQLLRSMGLIVAIIGGFFTAFQRHLARILAFAAVTEIGFSLIALSFYAGRPLEIPQAGIFIAQFLPRAVSMAVWGLSLSAIQAHSPSLSFRSVQSTIRQTPIAAISLVLANLSLAGLPLLASFPVNLTLLNLLARQSLMSVVLAMLASLGLMVAALRTLAVFVMSQEKVPGKITENRVQSALLIIGCLLMVVIGILPQLFFPNLTEMARIFTSQLP